MGGEILTISKQLLIPFNFIKAKSNEFGFNLLKLSSEWKSQNFVENWLKATSNYDNDRVFQKYPKKTEIKKKSIACILIEQTSWDIEIYLKLIKLNFHFFASQAIKLKWIHQNVNGTASIKQQTGSLIFEKDLLHWRYLTTEFRNLICLIFSRLVEAWMPEQLKVEWKKKSCENLKNI